VIDNTTMSVKGATLDLRAHDKLRGVQISALSLPRVACRRTSPTPARRQLLQECHCKTFGRHGRASCKWTIARRTSMKGAQTLFQRKMYHMQWLVGNLHGTEARRVRHPKVWMTPWSHNTCTTKSLASGADEQLPQAISEEERLVLDWLQRSMKDNTYLTFVGGGKLQLVHFLCQG